MNNLPSEDPVAGVFLKFREYLKSSGYSTPTVKNYLADLNHFLSWGKNQSIFKPAALTRVDIQLYAGYLKEAFKTKPSIISRRVSSLRKFLSWASKEGVVSTDLLAASRQTKEAAVPFVDDIAASYRATLKERNLSAPTVKNYVADQRAFLLWLKGRGKTLQALKQSDIENYAFYLNSSFPDKPSIVSRKTSSLRTFLSWASKEGLVKTLPLTIGVRDFLADEFKKISSRLPAITFHKKLIRHLGHDRPDWYHRYHRWGFAATLNYILLVIFLIGVGGSLTYFYVLRPEMNSTKKEMVAEIGGVLGAASPPRILSFQGRLTSTTTGQPIIIATTISFRIYTDDHSDAPPSACANTCLWESSTRSVTPDANGIFSVTLGDSNDVTPIPATLFTDHDELYLGVKAGGDSEMTPRQRIASSSYALNSAALEGYAAASFLRSDTSDSYTSGTLTFSGGTFVNLSSSTIAGASPLVFDGTTADTVKTTFAITDPTISNKTITFPDNSGTVVLDTGAGTTKVTAAANADGFSLAGGTTSRTLTVTGSNITLTGGGNTLTLSGSATLNQSLTTSSTPSFSTVTSTIATGNAPFTVSSTTKVTNLNADKWDDLDMPALDSGKFLTNNGSTLSWAAAGGSSALSSITAAVGANSINSGDNAQTWNWSLTTDGKTAFTFGENSASTNGTGSQYILSASTLATSTAAPFKAVARGNTIIDTTAAGGVTIGNATAAQAINIDAGTANLNIGTSNNAKTINIGNTTGATGIVERVGTGNYSLDGVAGSTYAIGASTTTGTITIGGTAQTGNITLGSSSGTNILALGAGEGATTVNIAGGATNAKTVNIGTGAAMANTITIGGTGANAITIGDTQTAGSISLGNAMTSGTIAIGGGSAVRTGNITIGSTGTTSGVLQLIGGTGVGAFGGTTSGIDIIPGVAGTINIGASGGAGTGTITLGQSTATNTIAIGNGASGATTVNIANASAAAIVNIGAAMTTGTITIGGTGLQTGTITFGGGTGAQIVNLGTGGTGIKTINLGTGNAGNSINIGTDNTTKDTISIGSAKDDVAITGNNWSISTSGALTTTGLITAAALPAGTGVGQGSLYINPASATANYTLLGVAVGGTQEFRVDAEGDTSVAGHLGVVGSSATDKLIYAHNGVADPSATFYGAYISPYMSLNVNKDNLYGVYTQSTIYESSPSIILTNLYDFYAAAPVQIGGETITNAYGLYVENITAAQMGTGIGVYIADAKTYSLQLASNDYDAAAGITFGSDGSPISLYRSAANTLSFGTTTNLVAAGALTIASGGSSALTLDSASGATILANEDALQTSITGVPGSLANGMIWYNNSTGRYNVREGGVTKELCNGTNLACGAGSGGALSAISAATVGHSIDSANFSQAWSWTTLTSEVGLDLTGGSAMTTGSLLRLNTTVYTHTVNSNETGSLMTLNFEDTSTDINAVTTTTNGIFIRPLILLVTGAGTKVFNGLSVGSPTTFTCTTGNCTLNDISVTTPTAGTRTATQTINGFNISATGVANAILNGINISAITGGTGTETAIKIGTGWDYDLFFAGSISATHTIKVQDAAGLTAAQTLQIIGAAGVFAASGGAITITPGTGGSSDGTGGQLNLNGGAGGGTNGPGGAVVLTGGVPVGTGGGGSISLQGGNAVGTSSGGSISLTTGNGAGTNQNAGTLTLNPGVPTGSGNATINLGSVNATNINIGTASVADTISIGNTTGATSLTLTSGTGNILLTPTGTAAIIKNNTVKSVVLANAALSTSATEGFVYIPTSVGNAIGAPTAQTGTVAMEYDTTNNKLLIYNGAWKGATAPGAWSDYAEMYPVASDAEYGDLMVAGPEVVEVSAIDGKGNVLPNAPKVKVSKLIKSTTSYASGVIGIVSNNYGDFTSTGYNVINPKDNPMPVALNGRVPVKVSAENGAIQPGDYLTTSATLPGYAMKATRDGMAIGKALEPFAGPGTGKIMVFIEMGYYPGPIEYQIAHQNQSASESPQLLKLDFNNDVVATVSAGAKFIWNDSAGQVVAWVSDTGEAVFNKVTALVGNFDKLVFGELAVKKDSQTAGQASLEPDQTEVVIKSDKVAEDSLIYITPTTKTDGLTLYIKEQKTGESFTVGLERSVGDKLNEATASATQAIKFNWLIVNQEK